MYSGSFYVYNRCEGPSSKKNFNQGEVIDVDFGNN